MENPVSLRPVGGEDLSQILEIEKTVHLAPWSLESFQAELVKPESTLWVLTDDETDSEISGYIVYRVLFESFEILNLAVSLSARGLGYGKLMVRKVVDQAIRQGAKKIILEVRKSNQAAIQLYQKTGFETVQVRKNFYSNGEEAYHMELKLDSEQVESL